MSGTILTSLWRRLHGQPLRVEEQVVKYQEYWRVVLDPEPDSNPACSNPIRTTLSWSPLEPDERLRGVHMGTCCADGQLWSYHVDRGWYTPTATELAAWSLDLDGRYDPCKE
jgi:hypothetical protein